MKLIFLMVSLAFFQNSLLACDKEGHSGVFPQNNLSLSVTQNYSGMTEAEFNGVIKHLTEIYTPILAEQNKKLKMEGKWRRRSVNAMTRLYKGTVEMIVYGGLARHKFMTVDGLYMTLCHEFGHHLGGAPKESDISGEVKYMSGEGQSDYYASLKCFRRVFINDNNEERMQDVQVHDFVEKNCQESFTNANEIALCKRSAIAAMAFVKTGQGIALPGEEVDFDRTDTREAWSTNHDYPESQCRLDTIINGSFCPVDYTAELSNTDPNLGTCNRVDGYERGLRPLCWYKP